MRLAEMSDAGAIPTLEQLVRVPVLHHAVAVEQDHPAAPASEGEGGREACESTSQHSDVHSSRSVGHPPDILRGRGSSDNSTKATNGAGLMEDWPDRAQARHPKRLDRLQRERSRHSAPRVAQLPRRPTQFPPGRGRGRATTEKSTIRASDWHAALALLIWWRSTDGADDD